MNKFGQIPYAEVIKLLLIGLFFIFIISPLFASLGDPEKFIQLLPGLILLALFFEILRRLGVW